MSDIRCSIIFQYSTPPNIVFTGVHSPQQSTGGGGFGGFGQTEESKQAKKHIIIYTIITFGGVTCIIRDRNKRGSLISDRCSIFDNRLRCVFDIRNHQIGIVFSRVHRSSPQEEQMRQETTVSGVVSHTPFEHPTLKRICQV